MIEKDIFDIIYLNVDNLKSVDILLEYVMTYISY